MNLYILTPQDVQHTSRGDYFDEILVAAPTAAAARKMHPYGDWPARCDAWASSPKEVHAELIGKAKQNKIPCILLKSWVSGA